MPLPLKLIGLSILVVEDEFIVAMDIERMLADIGCRIVGPVSSVTEATALAQAAELDGALLDVNVQGQKIFPVAEALKQRRIPFIFLTGYSSSSAGLEQWSAVRVMNKPFAESDLVKAMLECLVRDYGTAE